MLRFFIIRIQLRGKPSVLLFHSVFFPADAQVLPDIRWSATSIRWTAQAVRRSGCDWPGSWRTVHACVPTPSGAAVRDKQLPVSRSCTGIQEPSISVSGPQYQHTVSVNQTQSSSQTVRVTAHIVYVNHALMMSSSLWHYWHVLFVLC